MVGSSSVRLLALGVHLLSLAWAATDPEADKAPQGDSYGSLTDQTDPAAIRKACPDYAAYSRFKQ